jgi:hypothetical protein
MHCMGMGKKRPPTGAWFCVPMFEPRGWGYRLLLPTRARGPMATMALALRLVHDGFWFLQQVSTIMQQTDRGDCQCSKDNTIMAGQSHLQPAG